VARYETIRRPSPKRQKELHPVWRGIGCLTILIVPILSYASAYVTLEEGLRRGWPIPPALLGAPRLPDLIWKIPVLAQLFAPIYGWNNLYAHLALTIVYIVVFAGLLSLGYAILYRFVGPPRYGPQDEPPLKHKPKPYKR